MIKFRDMPSLEYLNICFILDPESPSGLRWKERPQSHFKSETGWKCHKTKCANKIAGTLAKQTNRWIVGLDGVNIHVHRIIYMMHYNLNDLPKDLMLDHIDRNPQNNQIDNLRLVTPFQNTANCTPHSNTGYPYVRKIELKFNKGFVYRVNALGTKLKTNFGTFKTLEEAKEISKRISIELYGDFSPYNNGLE